MLSQRETGDNRHAGYFWPKITARTGPRRTAGRRAAQFERLFQAAGKGDVRQPPGDLPDALGIVLAVPLAAVAAPAAAQALAFIDPPRRARRCHSPSRAATP